MSKDLRHFLFFHPEYNLRKFRLIQFLHEKKPIISKIIVKNKNNGLLKKFIIESFAKGYKKLLIITGKGLRSKVHNNPYLSEQMNVLKHSVPEFIKNDEDLFGKISKISTADLKDGGEGAFYIFLKRKKNL